MSCTLRFFSDTIDVNQEAINPLTGVPGQSLLHWLLQSLSPTTDEPRAVAEGWQAQLRYQGRRYRILVSGQTAEGQDGTREWLVALECRRNWIQRLLGLGGMKPADPLVAAMLTLLRRESGFFYITAQHS